ncbi:response regulator [Pollutimonas bauzanensis]|uniref:Two component transcriptional regulator, LuxR family n=1 Tax=Pollutimonas bauzanensis TaxID=658167 RepID=A0A1M5W9E4_9BURK|nr:response regulator [Pollutimonas bauzanensis]SHH84199.1 two component transcriptional regulator, LuxR family [Pollutimonas bauzanensis]
MDKPTSPISVLLVDDHKLFRSGIRSLLQRHADFVVVGEAAEGLEGVKRARQLLPDVILLDLNMPGISGLETLQLILQECPAAAVIMLTVSEDAEDLTAALQAGARGYLVKNIDADFLVRAIRRAAAGEPVIAETMTAKLVAQLRGEGAAPPAAAPAGLDKLTPREKDTLACLARGESNKMIARSLDVSESTVKIHVQSILKKLELSSRVQAAIFAVEHGVVPGKGETRA